jgi:Flp pilus assembly protein TadD
MSEISLGRRCVIAGVSLLIAACLFRGQLASALVTRGDDALRNGARTAAITYYSRAAWIAPTAHDPADRLAFLLATSHRQTDALAAVAVASKALSTTGDDAALLADRGLAQERLGRWTSAERDFRRAGAVGRDARYDHLAGRIALRLGRTHDARRLFELALVHDPSFGPARFALAGLR